MAGKISTRSEQMAAQAAAPQMKSINVIMNGMLDGEGMRKRFNDLLGARAPQFISSIVSMVNADQNMQAAFLEAPMTVIQSALKAAAFDLPFDQSLGYAYIVPFKNYDKASGTRKSSATFILGWKGMHQLALRTGVYKTINVLDVREGELRSYNRLTEEIDLQFIEDEAERNSKPIVGYVGYYKLVNGAEKTIYRSKSAIEAHEKKFRKGDYMGKGWRDDWDAMARKTVYRELIGKWGVMSITYQSQKESAQLADALAADETATASMVVDAEPAEPVPVDEATGEVVQDA